MPTEGAEERQPQRQALFYNVFEKFNSANDKFTSSLTCTVGSSKFNHNRTKRHKVSRPIGCLCFSLSLNI